MGFRRERAAAVLVFELQRQLARLLPAGSAGANRGAIGKRPHAALGMGTPVRCGRRRVVLERSVDDSSDRRCGLIVVGRVHAFLALLAAALVVSQLAYGPAGAAVAAVAQRIAEGEEGFDEAKIAAMNLVPDQYRGLDRFEARKAVIADISAEGNAVMIADPKHKDEDTEAPLVPYVENKKIMQPFGDRSGVVIEPMLTDHWFVDAETLAKPAIAAVREGRTKFVPENWDRTYYNWMENIEPWCISRQLWWGHRIPVWYGPPKDDLESSERPTLFVGKNIKDVERQAREFYETEVKFTDVSHPGMQKFSGSPSKDGKLISVQLTQDDDVLDTWFSSGLWPFSTQGWPEQTDGLKTFYPGATLVTAFDIIFFWVARMMMLGIKFMDGEVPFKDVYIHAIVRDENGKKMSKSEGNVVDPVDLIDGIEADALVAKRTTGLRQPEKAPQVEKATRKRYPDGFEAYGADALRFTLAAMATKGRDINLSVERVAGYRNFGTKLWNATRFAQMNEAQFGAKVDPQTLDLSINKWIVSELYKCTNAVSEAIEDYRFNDAASAAYHFTWDVLCDWYLELSKPILGGDDAAAKKETQTILGWILEQTYVALHPFMPFITDVLWELTADRSDFLMQLSWPGLHAGFEDQAAVDELGWVLRVISQIRSVRSDVNVPAGAKVPVSLTGASDETARCVEVHRDVIMRLARLEKFDLAETAPAGSVKTVVGEATVALEIADLIDKDEEIARLTKRLAKLESEITGLEKRLGNEAFVAKAPADVVAEQRERLADLKQTRDKLRLALEQLADI